MRRCSTSGWPMRTIGAPASVWKRPSMPATTAGMEGLFHTEAGAPIVLMGQPDVEHRRIDNPIAVNKVLSFLIYGTTSAQVRGLDQFPEQDWPTNIPLLYFSYHVMAGLGTIFVGIMALAAILLRRGALF